LQSNLISYHGALPSVPGTRPAFGERRLKGDNMLRPSHC